MRGMLKISGIFLVSAALFFTFLPAALSPFQIAPAAAQTASSAAKEKKLENIIITEPLLTFKIKSLSVIGGPLSESDLAALFDSKSSQPMFERLRQLSADMILVSEMSVEKTGEMEEVFIYRDVKLEQVAFGVAAKVSAAEANFTINRAQDSIFSGAYGKTLAEIFDISLAAAMITETSSGADVEKKLLYKAFTVDGFTCADPTSEFALSVKELSAHDVKARPLGQLTFGPPKDNETAQPERRLGDYLASVWEGFDIGDAKVTGLHTAARSEEKSIIFVLDGLQVHDLKAGRIDRADFTGLDVQSENMNVKLHDLVIGGIDLRDVVFAPEQRRVSGGDIKPRSPNFVTLAETLDLSGLELVFRPDPDPGHAAQDNPSVRQGGFTLAKAETKHIPAKDGGPEQFSASFTNFIGELHSGHDGPGNALANLGYSKLDVSGHVELSINSANELNVSDITMSGADLGKIKASLIAENVTSDVLSPDPSIAEAAFNQVVLKHIDLQIDDFSLLSKVIAHQAAIQHKTIDETRDSYVSAAGMLVPVLLGGGPSSKEIGSAVAKFIADPKRFHILANAPLGLTAADLSLVQDPAALLKKLKIEVSAGP